MSQFQSDWMKDSYDYPGVLATYRVEIAAVKIPNLFACFSPKSCQVNLEVDPVNLRFLFQGVTDEAKRGKAYGDIPWRLGILEPADHEPQ